MAKLKVLITGAAGRVGQALLTPFRDWYDLRCLDHKPVPGDPGALNVSLTDFAAVRRACDGMAVVVHLAARAGEGDFAGSLVPSNIVGVQHLLSAAVEARVRRVVYASSAQVSTGYPRGRRIESDEPYRPRSVYGVTKAFGELLGRYYHDAHGLEFVALRLGSFLPLGAENLRPGAPARETWLSPADGVEAFRLAVEKPGLGYATVFVTSITERERVSRKGAREILGFEPKDTLSDAAEASWKTETGERS